MVRATGRDRTQAGIQGGSGLEGMIMDDGTSVEDIQVDPRTYNAMNGYWPIASLANRYLHQHHELGGVYIGGGHGDNIFLDIAYLYNFDQICDKNSK